MVSSSNIKSIDFYRKIPRDLTEASLSGPGLSIAAALCMIFLFGMELSNYLAVTTSTSIIVDKSSDEDFLLLHLNLSFPSLSCEFASVDVSDVLGTNRLNITKTIRKYSIDSDLRITGSEFHSGSVGHAVKHDDIYDEEHEEGSFTLNANNFDMVSHEYPILMVNFYAPWCYWSNRLKPSWEKAAKIIRERYDPEMDGRILIGKVDCTEADEFCQSNHIQGYPSIRIFRKGGDVREDHGKHERESYYGDRDKESLVQAMEALVASIPTESGRHTPSADKPTETVKRPAPLTGGCIVEGFVRVKKMNMSHVISHLTFGRKISPRFLSDVKRLLPYIGGSHDRLGGRAFINHHDVGANVTIEHYLQVVKTEVVTRGNHKLIEEYEFTAHSSLVETLYIPVAKFHYEVSPMQVLITENPESFSHFLTNLCAIIGGTVAGILDSLLHNTVRLMKKVELGKNI